MRPTTSHIPAYTYSTLLPAFQPKRILNSGETSNFWIMRRIWKFFSLPANVPDGHVPCGQPFESSAASFPAAAEGSRSSTQKIALDAVPPAD